MTSISDRFQQLLENDSTVRNAAMYARSGMVGELDALKAGIICLVEQRNAIAAEAAKLRAIAPRRIRGANGSVYRWDAPDELVEVE